MNKKNKKKILQNKRNKIINKYYTSNIKFLFKVFLITLKNLNLGIKDENKKKLVSIFNHYYSLLDKAVKKNIFSSNKANKKKAYIMKIYKTI